jgi:hypothetical protein
VFPGILEHDFEHFVHVNGNDLNMNVSVVQPNKLQSIKVKAVPHHTMQNGKLVVKSYQRVELSTLTTTRAKYSGASSLRE